MITKKHRSKGGESKTHKTQNKSTITHTKPQLELTTQLEEFSTQMGLKSLSQRIECARMESWCLGMIKECLGYLLHAPRGPFYSPKAARSRWRHSWKAKVAFYRVAHRTVRCATGQLLFMSGARFPSKSGAADRCRLVAVGAPDTIRCTPDSPVPLPTVGASHASSADLAADRCAGGCWLTEQSGEL
jgi:hypothetical protein